MPRKIGEVVIDKEVEEMTNEQIRDSLIKLGQNVGPVVGSTREIYKRKLIALRSNLDQKVQPKVLPPSTTVPNVRLTGEGDLEQIKGDPLVVAQVQAMSDEEIHSALKGFGKDPGPNIPSMRKVNAKWLIKLTTRKFRAEAGVVGDDEFSDNEDMDWSPN